MVEQLEGKVALVTGGGSGIGRASALAFARDGAKVVIADIDVGGGEATVQMIKEGGGEAALVHADVSKAAQVQGMVDRIVGLYGRLDCAFNNAGISTETNAWTADCSEEDWDRVIGINLKGVWLCMKSEIPQMLKQGGGAIVNTASVAGLVGIRSRSAYVASKHAVVGLTKSAALEYAESGIRVNAVCPGYTRTPLVQSVIDHDPEHETRAVARQPLGRLGRPEEIAAAVVWLSSDAASFVTGHTMLVDGGFVAQ